MKMLMVQIVWWILFSQFVGKFAQTFAPMFGVVLCEHKYIVPTLRVGVSLNQGFQSGNRVACPSQSKLFLRFRSVHSDVVQVYNQPLLDTIIICRSHKPNEPTFFQFIYELL